MATNNCIIDTHPYVSTEEKIGENCLFMKKLLLTLEKYKAGNDQNIIPVFLIDSLKKKSNCAS